MPFPPRLRRHPNPRCERIVSLLLLLCLLAAPVAALAPKGQKNFKRGIGHEAAQQWEKAAEEFALAVAAEPSNAEYQLHYRRAVFNASQTFMQKGAASLERGDYLEAYNAFRRAYGYDQANELARSMMGRALRLQTGGGVADPRGDEAAPSNQSPAAGRLAPAAYGRARPGGESDDSTPPAPRVEQMRVISYSGDLEKFIKYIARELRLNVVFDRDFPRRAVEVDLQEVTAAQALDYVFLTQGLFFQKLSSRTILVADQTKRPQYQQLVLRTFYLFNIEPNEVRQLIQASIPPQAGRQPVITPNKSTNSITVRDTPENVRLVGELLKSIDKERSEVVMDVQIYEVSRNDLMQFGNQLGGEASLHNLGGITKGLSILGGSREVLTQGAGALAAPTALGAALVIPASALNAIQRKDSTRLIASTQVHAFDGEKSTAHIGQRVPVQTASVSSFGTVNTGEGNNNPQPGVAPGLFGGNGYPVIQYEKTGLTLEFTPQVFPNLDVQVKMSIKSNDVSAAGGASLTPTFTERNIEGTARIQNNRTMMIASVAQNQQSRGRQGLPVLGLVPVLGRLFTAPRRNDQQTDIVIAVTPRVLRAPALTPDDEESHPSGTLQTPTTETLEAMLEEVAREEQLAAARLIPTERVVMLPDADQHAYIPAPKALLNDTGRAAVSADASTAGTAGPAMARPRRISAAAYEPAAEVAPSPAALSPESVSGATPGAPPRSGAELRFAADTQEMRVGERRRLSLLLKTDAPLGLAALSLRFDPRVLAVRSVACGDLFGGGPGAAALTQTVSPGGVLLASVAPQEGARAFTGAGVLLSLEIEALAEGASALGLATADVHLIATDGRQIILKVTPGRVTARR